jgi:uncharacterized protein
MFFYRQKELEILESDFLKPNSSFNFIFGRKKIGKTSFINEYIKNKETLYLSCFETMSDLLIKKLKETIDNFFTMNNNLKVENLEQLFIYISEQKIEGKIVIVLENINYLQKIEKDFISQFNNYWTKYLKNKNIQFLITSSFYSTSSNDIFVYKKADNIIKLKSLDYTIINNILPNLDKKDWFYVYSTFGTNPSYLKYYDTNKNFQTNLKENFLAYDSMFFNEGMNILKSDLSEILTYSSILYAISLGNRKIGDIANFLNLKSSYLTRYMQKLVELMILEKVVPINENPLKSKFGRYEIEDNFLKFWFAFIYTNFDSFQNKEIDTYQFIKDDIDKILIQDAYKKYLLDEINTNPQTLLDFIPNKFGSWWNNRDIEIDIVAYNSKEITFLECNYFKKDNEKIYKNLIDKSKFFDTTLTKNYEIMFNK